MCLDSITNTYNDWHDQEEWIYLHWASPGNPAKLHSINPVLPKQTPALSLNLSPREYAIELTHRYNELAEYSIAISEYLDNVVNIMMEHNFGFCRRQKKQNNAYQY